MKWKTARGRPIFWHKTTSSDYFIRFIRPRWQLAELQSLLKVKTWKAKNAGQEWDVSLDIRIILGRGYREGRADRVIWHSGTKQSKFKAPDLTVTPF